ncbi:MAG: hypothetical protein ISS43_00180 [Candidatus Omnitrophica bacterium]|nr:hypothetical protein [Candidatus Omnitrophota bacterium]
MNPALPKTLCKAIDMLGYAIKRKGGVNPALPKTLCKAIDMLGYAIKRKGGVNPALPKPPYFRIGPFVLKELRRSTL